MKTHKILLIFFLVFIPFMIVCVTTANKTCKTNTTNTKAATKSREWGETKSFALKSWVRLGTPHAMGHGRWLEGVKGGERNGFKILCNMATKQKPEGRRTKVAAHQESNRAWYAEGGTKGVQNGGKRFRGGYQKNVNVCSGAGEWGEEAAKKKSGKNSGKNSFYTAC